MRPHPVPPPAGEGAAHKGGRRGRTRRERNVEMTAAAGVRERIGSLLAVRFSLFRHPPRGGSADATFPRRGKELAVANSPNVAACLWCCCRGVGTPPPTMKCCGFAYCFLKTRCCCAARRPRRALLRNSRSPSRSICHCKGRPSGKAGSASPAMVYKYARRSSASLASRRISLAAVSRLGPSAAAYWFR